MNILPGPNNEVWIGFNTPHGKHGRVDKLPRWIAQVVAPAPWLTGLLTERSLGITYLVRIRGYLVGFVVVEVCDLPKTSCNFKENTCLCKLKKFMLRASVGLITNSRKKAKNLDVRRKNWNILTVSRKVNLKNKTAYDFDHLRRFKTGYVSCLCRHGYQTPLELYPGFCWIIELTGFVSAIFRCSFYE